MPLLWRYVLRNYLLVFFLSVASFVSVLLVTRFQTIARFAATGAPKLSLLQFTLYQIPFILPLAIPVSCLIASLILFKKMSQYGELTALRTAGLGLRNIAFPILAAGFLLSLANFTFVSEVSPKCRAFSKGLIYEMTAINPLSLLQKETLVKLKNTYIDMKVLKSGKYAEDVTFITRGNSNQRLGLMVAKKISLKKGELLGKDVSFVSSVDANTPDTFDHLIIENQSEMKTKAEDLCKYLRTKDWNFNYDYLPFRLLLAKNRIEAINGARFHPKAASELARRLSLGIAAFTFTLLGVAYGVEISRTRSLKGVLIAASMATFTLLCFVAGKSVKHDPTISAIFYLLPHPILFFLSLRTLTQTVQGAE